MTSLTIQLDKETDALLNQMAHTLQQSKLSLVEDGIARHLQNLLVNQQREESLKTSITCHSKDDILQRIAASESSDSVSSEEYDKRMDDFFSQEFGLKR